MHTRREFLGAMSLPLGAAALGATPTWRPVQGDLTDWSEVQRAFTVDRSLVNLNNGAVSPSPEWVQEAMARHLAYSNACPPYTMWEILEPQREGVRERLARQWGVDAEEIALTRNASEGLMICQFGFDLQPGDEVLTTTQDYQRMQWAFDQRAKREGIVVKRISIPVPCEDDDEIVARFADAITPRTRLILMCHMINLTGQILPVKRVVAMAREVDVPVIIDGAHALAHVEFKLSDLDCDYYATSLHKWLFAPHGTGLLYVRRDKIADLWPLMAPPERMTANIRKFEEIGTHPAANYLAIGEALTFNQSIGLQRKEDRLRERRNAWVEPLLQYDRVRLNTSLDPRYSCGIANMRIDGVNTRTLKDHLWNRHRIVTIAITHDEFEGLRVTPSVYTTDEELARFVEAVEEVIKTS